MGMTIDQRRTCVSESLNYTDREAYISDMALSSIWGGAEDAEIPADRIDELGRIWDRTHRDFRGVVSASGLSCRKVAERFSIPYRTAEDWHCGKANPPAYVLLMMQEILGI